MPTYPIGITRSFGTWRSNDNHVERAMDNSAYDAAHPDNTLILAGPARKGVSIVGGGTRTMRAIGHFQQFAFSTTAPVQAAQAIGSARSFFLRGKSQTQWQCARLLMNGPNILRAFYHNAVELGLPVDQFDDPASMRDAASSQFFINLDSELYYIPIGFGVTIRTKSRTLVGGCYLELCMVQSWGTQITSGGMLTSESVNGLCDRLLPHQASDAMSAARVGRQLMDAVLGLGQTPLTPAGYTSIPTIPATGLDNAEMPGV